MNAMADTTAAPQAKPISQLPNLWPRSRRAGGVEEGGISGGIKARISATSKDSSMSLQVIQTSAVNAEPTVPSVEQQTTVSWAVACVQIAGAPCPTPGRGWWAVISASDEQARDLDLKRAERPMVTLLQDSIPSIERVQQPQQGDCVYDLGSAWSQAQPCKQN